MRVVRVLTVTLLPLLAAGCAMPGSEPTQEPLFGRCPEWIQGGAGVPGTLDVGNGTATATVTLAPANMTYQGRPFDMLRLDVKGLKVEGANARLRAFGGAAEAASANATRLNLRDFAGPTPEIVPQVVLAPGSNATMLLEAYLSSVAQDVPARPGPVLLEFALVDPAMGAAAHLDYTATFHYKVCGA